MTTKADFTPDEWLRLERAPLVAGMAIAVADPSGPIEEYKELGATTKTVLEAAGGGRSELVDAVAKDVAELAKQRQDPLQEIEPQGPVTAEQVVDELKAVKQLLSDKASPEDAAAFRELLLTAAQRAALVEQLRGQELEIRYDQVLLNIGESLIERLSAEISAGDFLVAVVSPDSVGSDWCKRELALAAT